MSGNMYNSSGSGEQSSGEHSYSNNVCGCEHNPQNSTCSEHGSHTRGGSHQGDSKGYAKNPPMRVEGGSHREDSKGYEMNPPMLAEGSNGQGSSQGQEMDGRLWTKKTQ